MIIIFPEYFASLVRLWFVNEMWKDYKLAIG